MSSGDMLCLTHEGWGHEPRPSSPSWPATGQLRAKSLRQNQVQTHASRMGAQLAFVASKFEQAFTPCSTALPACADRNRGNAAEYEVKL